MVVVRHVGRTRDARTPKQVVIEGGLCRIFFQRPRVLNRRRLTLSAPKAMRMLFTSKVVAKEVCFVSGFPIVRVRGKIPRRTGAVSAT